MDLKELHRQYGELMIQVEIIQGKIQECKRNIAQAMNNPIPKKESKKEKNDKESNNQGTVSHD